MRNILINSLIQVSGGRELHANAGVKEFKNFSIIVWFTDVHRRNACVKEPLCARKTSIQSRVLHTPLKKFLTYVAGGMRDLRV